MSPLDPKIGTSEFIRPVLDRFFPLETVGQALAYFESGHAKGKVIIGGPSNASQPTLTGTRSAIGR
ncbi:MAG: zinc-binding dehydrogenase [Sphingomonas sp.]